jgi:excisionase family DNA binding protein
VKVNKQAANTKKYVSQGKFLKPMSSITFEQMPTAVAELLAEVRSLKAMLGAKGTETRANEPERLMTIAEAAEFLNLTVNTIYGLNSRNEIPSMKKGKRVYFLKSELTLWIKSGRNLTVAEAKEAATNYDKKNKAVK